ncbi:MAG: PEP-utilizing enzyme [Chloroflexaceae bacterium]|jgi:pyruvate,water dikinase|nr:PEP-utilizing enzyme [Chloroflexaceae bacterium]
MLILPFTAPTADLPTAGGKGTNLARLTRAGFPVPPGFIVATAAYRQFVDGNRLTDVITAAIAGVTPDDAGQLEAASATIRAAFVAGTMPSELEQAIRASYAELGEEAVAVRSSATAEDLPDLSFAGQQDSYLNMVGAEALLTAVVDCWSSLWTARAIGYRMRNAIAHHDASLAVVVQLMVQSEVSGVLFTANPLSGLLSETVIEATFGLGEALVSGQVEPDRFVVDTLSGEIFHVALGSKQMATRSKRSGGVETIALPNNTRQTLTEVQLKQLAALGQRVQREYGTAQDIEWAIAGEKLYLLQSRAITSLFPVPEYSPNPLKVWFSFGAVQGLVGPITPLGRDTIQHVIIGGGRLFGVGLTPAEQRIIVPAGERLWIKLSDLIRNPVGNRVIGVVLRFIEPSVGQIIASLVADPRLAAGQGSLKFSTIRRIAHFARPLPLRIGRNLLNPTSARAAFDSVIDDYLSTARLAPAADRFGQLTNIVTFLRELTASAFPLLIPHFVPLIGPGMLSLALLHRLAGNQGSLALEVTRGLPANVTTEMDLALWATATHIRDDAESAQVFDTCSASDLAQQYLQGALPGPAQAAIGLFMERYGMRGLGEIDVGQPRWREEPTAVMHTLQSYLHIAPEFAPDVQFAQGRKAAYAAIEQLARLVRQQRGGWFKEQLVRAAAWRVRTLLGARESPKFFIIRLMGLARAALLEAGTAFVEAGTLQRPDDLAFLDFAELQALSRNEPRDWQALIAERRAAYAREGRRGQVPRVLASDGRAFYEGLSAQATSGEQISGSPVSPGVAEGVVHVVFDPASTRLAPGEILVCRGTDPAWTPLFLVAGGLVTEVGGMMTHGSVVAREYGIPAVVGVHQATERLKTGQRIRLDGRTGTIEVVE